MSSTLHRINFGCMNQGLALLPAKLDGLNARAQLLKTGMQESRFLHRRQQVGSPPRPVGPAAGFWQFERGATQHSGIRGVVNHQATGFLLRQACNALDVPFDVQAIWEAIQQPEGDALAVVLARLNLLWNPRRLPAWDDERGSWEYYLECWRPGKPHRHTWAPIHETVCDYLVDRN